MPEAARTSLALSLPCAMGSRGEEAGVVVEEGSTGAATAVAPSGE